MKKLFLIAFMVVTYSVNAQKTEVTIVIEIPTDKVAEFRDLFCIEFERPDSITVNNARVINPEGKTAFVKRVTSEHILTWYRNIYISRKRSEEVKKIDTYIDLTIK